MVMSGYERVKKCRDRKYEVGFCYECGCHEERVVDQWGNQLARCKKHLDSHNLREKMRRRYKLGVSNDSRYETSKEADRGSKETYVTGTGVTIEKIG